MDKKSKLCKLKSELGKGNENKEIFGMKFGIVSFVVLSIFILFVGVASAECGYSGGISIQKSANTTSLSYGGYVEYNYLVMNNGNNTIWGVVVWDDKLGVVCTINNLSVGENFTCNKTIYLNESTTNIATVSGWIDACTGICAETNLTISVYHPLISLNKTANVTIVNYGESVEYTYNITNTGDVPLSNVSVTDDKCSPVNCPKTSLNPGESMICSCITNLTENTTNIATATGTAPNGQVVSASDKETVIVIVNPAIKIIKHANASVVNYGESVEYTYNITNTGDVPLSNVSVTDDKCSPVNCPKTSLNPGESMICSCITNLTIIIKSSANVSANPKIDGLIGDVPSQISDEEYGPGVLHYFTQDSTGNYLYVGTLYAYHNITEDVWHFAFVYTPDMVNDNSYAPKGTLLPTWQWKNGKFNSAGGEHTFEDLLGSDKLQCKIKDSDGKVVLDFKLDLLAKNTAITPNYGSGGHNCSPYSMQCDGGMTSGDPNMILDYATSTEWNMQNSNYPNASVKSPDINNTLYLATGEYKIIEEDPKGNPYSWEFKIIYEFKINGSVLGGKDLGYLDIYSVHNSPYKKVSGQAYPGITNVGTATGTAPNGQNVIDSSNATVIVKIGEEVKEKQCMKTIGFWKHQFEVCGDKNKGKSQIDCDTLKGYLPINVFGTTISNLEEGYNVLWIKKASMKERAIQQCFATLLNFKNCAATNETMVDTNYDKVPDTTFADAMNEAESNFYAGNYEKAKDICDSINNMKE